MLKCAIAQDIEYKQNNIPDFNFCGELDKY